MGISVTEVLDELRANGNRKNVEGMARYGITSARAFGVSAPVLHRLARKIGTDHELALELWSTGIHEARSLSALTGDPAKVTKSLMNKWAKDFDNWAVCDCACTYLFDRTPYAYEMALAWTGRNEEFVKRAGFSLMAVLAVHDKNTPDAPFLKFLPIIKRGSTDPRNFVRKAVNWSLRQIGKRNRALNAAAIKMAKSIQTIDCPSARWVAADALRELESSAVQKRLRTKEKSKRKSRG
jgi:3-methyladenine DNA glycosylase AlkD